MFCFGFFVFKESHTKWNLSCHFWVWIFFNLTTFFPPKHENKALMLWLTYTDTSIQHTHCTFLSIHALLAFSLKEILINAFSCHFKKSFYGERKKTINFLTLVFWLPIHSTLVHSTCTTHLFMLEFGSSNRHWSF